MAVPRVYDDFGQDDTRLDPRALLGHVLSPVPVAPAALPASVRERCAEETVALSAPQAVGVPSPLGLNDPPSRHAYPPIPIYASSPAVTAAPPPAFMATPRVDSMQASMPTYVAVEPARSNTTVVLLGILAGVVGVGILGAFVTFF